MAVITKITFNNQIVKMRHTAKQAKVHCIHKLVKTLRQLVKKSSDRPDTFKQRLEKKAEKVRDEILTLKELKVDEISAFALVNTSDSNILLGDPKSGPKVRALARLSLHSRMQAAVKLFKADYPDWRETFPAVLIALKRGQKLKLPKKVDIPSDQPDDKNNDVSEDNAVSKDEVNDDMSVSEDAEDDNEIVSEDMDADDVVDEADDVEDEADDVVDEADDLEAEADDTEPLGNKFANNQNSSKLSLKNKSGTFTVTTPPLSDSSNLADASKKESSEPSSNVDNESPQENENQPKIKAPVPQTRKEDKSKEPQYVDPFFLRKDNSEYHTLAPVDNDEDPDQSEQFIPGKNMNSDMVSKKSFLGKGIRKHPISQGSSDFKSKQPFKKKFGQSGSNFKSKQPFQKTFPKRSTETKSNELSIDELHPSWAAKKKMSSIMPFQGKKITFD